ncbi:hypothetical protein ACO0E1_06085 [Curtobacterium sp. RRHDQ66]|uniref:hypothetical protein n=1 Tax=Curtobacterium guangdongense TaxID=3413380 RepID=UPI003BF2E03B
MRTNSLRSLVLVAVTAATAATAIAAPAAAAPSVAISDVAPAASGTFTTGCGGIPGGEIKVSWTREGSAYTATIDQYKLSPAHGQTNKTGEVQLGINGGSWLTETKLTSDNAWHDLGASTTATVPAGNSIEHTFTLTYSGFPTYPHCSGSKWL